MKRKVMAGCESKPITHATLERKRRWHVLMKSAGDYLLASFALIIFSPSIIVISFAIAIESGWPVFVRSRCRGAGEKTIGVLKFRTVAVPRYGGTVTPLRPMRGYPTRIGRILRQTRLDGLPMLLNVLNGDLAFSGPPPLPEDDTRQYWEKPGMFGPRKIEKPGRK
jgi:lipopolysaccharide/colanic/teichoic acid biosynthesis glycosyltransferase